MEKLNPAPQGQYFQSPDGKWFWTYEFDNPAQDEVSGAYYYITHFVHADDGREWKVQFQHEYFERLGARLASEVFYTPFFWLPNDPYVYLTGYACCIDGPVYFFSGMNLARLNLETGEFSVQIPGWRMHSFAFSDNGKYLLDGNLWDKKLSFYQLMTGLVTEIALPEKYSRSGDASFSPDNTQVAIQTCVDDEQGECTRFALLIVDIEAKQYREVIPDLLLAMGSDKYVRTVTSWAGDTQVLLEERNHSNNEVPRRWMVDITKRKLVALK